MESDPINERVQIILDRWEDEREQGRSLTAGELCGDCPELEAEVARLIQALIAMDHVLTAPNRETDASGASERLRSTARCEIQLDEIQFHDRGGQGEVCVARDERLKRTVALKYIHPSRKADPASYQRFVREAEITGMLEHPGIVPIYGVNFQDGDEPCYVMRKIDGMTLADAVNADTLSGLDGLRELLRRFVFVCNTIAYAHSKGVLHRDLKPNNIMIGRFGETFVIDWGMAKLIGEDREPAHDEAPIDATTGPGIEQNSDLIGAIPFLSPERLQGEPSTTADDIYALGATLRGIIAPARDVESHQDRPRPIDPPAALTAIAAKAMAFAPQGRYQNALDLAADVDRWLTDQPISARRDPLSERLARVMRHHPTWVASLVFLLIGVGLLSWALNAQARGELREYLRRREELIWRSASMQFEGLRAELAWNTQSDLLASNDEMIRTVLKAVEAGARDIEAIKPMLEVVRGNVEERSKIRSDRIFSSGKFVELQGEPLLERIITDLRTLLRDYPSSQQTSKYRLLLAHVLLTSAHMASDKSPFSAEIHSNSLDRLEEALIVLQPALDADPNDSQTRDKVGLILAEKSACLFRLRRFTEGLRTWQEVNSIAPGSMKDSLMQWSIPILVKAAEMEQSSAPWSRPPKADHARAMELASYLAELKGVSDKAIYNAACTFSLASGDPSIVPKERDRRAGQAVAYLRRIADHGYFRGILAITQRRELDADPDLQPIRGRADFQSLRKQVLGQH